jgi:hypothetical protein
VESRFFEDRALFPSGSVAFDCALLMRGIDHEWHGRESLSANTRSLPLRAMLDGRSGAGVPPCCGHVAGD